MCMIKQVTTPLHVYASVLSLALSQMVKLQECEESANLCPAKPLLCFIKQKSQQQIYHFLKTAHLVPAGNKGKDTEIF